MPVYAVKTTVGQERIVADMLVSRAHRTGDREGAVYALLSPSTLRGYLLVEATDPDVVTELLRGVPHTRGLVKGETNMAEVEHFLTPEPPLAGVSEGDIVELIAGPFKGEKAKVLRLDETKEEITVQLFETAVPIPVTVMGSHVKMLEKGER